MSLKGTYKGRLLWIPLLRMNTMWEIHIYLSVLLQRKTRALFHMSVLTGSFARGHSCRADV